MDDSQWCLDECPTCATVVHGTSLYCSPECEPDVDDSELELEPPYAHAPWSHSRAARVSAWALDCYKSALAPPASGAPCILPSPSRRKLHLRKQYPTAWLTPGTPPHTHSFVSESSPLSTCTAVDSLVSSCTKSPAPHRAWASASPAPSPAPPPPPPTRAHPLLTKTTIYLRARAEPHAAPPRQDAWTPADVWVARLAASVLPRCPLAKPQWDARARDDP